MAPISKNCYGLDGKTGVLCHKTAGFLFSRGRLSSILFYLGVTRNFHQLFGFGIVAGEDIGCNIDASLHLCGGQCIKKGVSVYRFRLRQISNVVQLVLTQEVQYGILATFSGFTAFIVRKTSSHNPFSQRYSPTLLTVDIILTLSLVVQPSAVVNRTSYLGSLPRTFYDRSCHPDHAKMARP